MTKSINFYFDFISPYSYLAHKKINIIKEKKNITFNYINVTFIFFRAKEWVDAVKVLGSMFSLDNIVFPSFLNSSFGFLNKYGIEFGGFVSNLKAGNEIILYILMAFIITLKFKNIYQYQFKENSLNLTIFVLVSIVSILKLNEYSEFLYFQF